MGTTRLFELVDTLLDKFPGVVPAGTNVFDSYSNNQDPSNFVMVGVEDPNASMAGQAGSVTQEFALAAGRSRNEAGEVVCAAVATRGDGDMRQCRADAKAIVDPIENWVRNPEVNTPFLGLPNLLWAGFGSDLQLLQDQTSQGGAVVTVIFRIAYKARI